MGTHWPPYICHWRLLDIYINRPLPRDKVEGPSRDYLALARQIGKLLDNDMGEIILGVILLA